MKFDFTPEQLAWRAEVRQFIDEFYPPDVRQDYPPGYHWESKDRSPLEDRFHKEMAARKWNGLLWPAEFGGLGRPAMDQFILVDELDYAGAPSLDLTVSSIGTIIITYGSDADKARWLPGIVDGSVTFALGYSEPDAGTDLASLKTRAELDGDEWVVNGQKIWNTGAHRSTHEWLAVRTNPTAAKHRGISILIVPIDTPGIEIRKIDTWGDERTNLVFFNDVRVPRDALFGELDHGWDYVRNALLFERALGPGRCGRLKSTFENFVRYCQNTRVGGSMLIDRPDVAEGIAKFGIDLEVVRLMYFSVAAIVDAGKVPEREVPTCKIALTELRSEFSSWCMDVLGMYGQLRHEDPRVPMRGAIELDYRFAPKNRFGGGTNEVMRDIIAQRGHGLPR
jgi:3-oxocholest-4-en-26-oyl-CoA dehydrogenase alpha subunit